jgi:hypothetical protein
VNKYFFFCLFLLFSACVTDSSSDLNEGLSNSRGVYLLQCGVEPCESVKYAKEKIQAIHTDAKALTKTTPADVLVPAFSGLPYNVVEEKARSVASEYVTLKQPTVPDEVLLTMALSASKAGKKSLAFYLFDKLLGSNQARIRSATCNAYGVEMYRENRLMEAVAFWKKSLEEEKENWAARLNLSIVSLRYHRFSLVENMEKKEKVEWAAPLLSAVEKMETGKLAEGETLCSDLLEKKMHIAIQYNCGVLFSKNPLQIKKAKSLLSTVQTDERVPEVKRKIASDILAKLQAGGT